MAAKDMSVFNRRLGALLAQNGTLSEEDRDKYISEANMNKKSLTELVLERGVCSDSDITAQISEKVSYHPINLEKILPDSTALHNLTEEQCMQYCVLPIAKLGKSLTVAISNPFDILVLDDLKLVTSCEIMPVVATDVAVKKAIRKAFGRDDPGAGGEAMQSLMDQAELSGGLEEIHEGGNDGPVDLEDINSEDSPVVKMCNLLITNALSNGTSDIHVEPFEKRLRIRYRIDGACQEQVAPPKQYHPALVSRIKILCGLDIAEKRQPQDGKFQMRFRGRQVDFRVSTLPMVHGEKVCIRILDASNLSLSMDSLGFEPQALNDFKWAVKAPYGMVLVTGPTGSGKSTTLYSAVREVLRIEDNITTVEDPVEYQMEGVNQVPVNAKRGLTFAAALRSILRQDPDTVMIGEIRDLETAQIAIKAALTGHLVFSTLHTNDAPSTVSRLVDMGIDPFMVASSVLLVSAQRLPRKLCKECKEPLEVPRERLLEIGVKEEELESATFFKPAGCGRCASGYKGRFAILETMPLADPLKRIIVAGGSAIDLRAKALDLGMITLRRCALLNAMRGKTSIEEVLAKTQDEV